MRGEFYPFWICFSISDLNKLFIRYYVIIHHNYSFSKGGFDKQKELKFDIH